MTLGVGVTLSYVGCHGYHITKYKTLMTLYLYKEPLEVNLEQIWYTYDKGNCELQPFKLSDPFEIDAIFGPTAT